MWRNCYYDNKESVIHEFTWDESGNRVEVTRPFKPFLLLETEKKTDILSVYDTYLYLKEFNSSYERYKFVKFCEERIFFNLAPEQQYLIGRYRKVDKSEFSKHELRTFFLDIECPAELEFPTPDKAKYEIDVLTLYDTLTKKFYIWGKYEYTPDNIADEVEKLGGTIDPVTEDDVVYFHIEDEKDRLEHFVSFWEENCPDVYTGWNTDGFDTEYIMNRVQLILGKNQHRRFSPVGKVISRETVDDFGNVAVKYDIKGVNSMDYMDIFKTFTFGKERESWKLDDVASDILSCGKIDLNGVSLFKMSRTQWKKYVAYNIVDVALLVSMDKKLDFISIGRETAYEGFSNITDCLGKIVTITGSIAKYGLEENRVIETSKAHENVPFAGGFVKEPEPRMRNNIMTFDATSLYPSNMLTLGTSHETCIGKILQENDEYIIYELHGDTKKMKRESFFSFLRDMKYCISCSNVIFDQNKEGIINKFVQKQFDNKQRFSKLSKKALAEGDEEMAKEYARRGQITKIFLNSCYGVISASKSPLYNLDIAESITLTGQSMIKEASRVVNEFARKHFGATTDVVIGGDTDSIFLDFSECLENKGQVMFENDELSEYGKKLSDLFTKVINEGTNKWAREHMCCINPRYNFEREKASSSALFFAKKQYAYYVNDNEGFPVPPEKRMKYTGLKVIRSEYSQMLKDMMNELYHTTLSQYLKLGHEECGKLMKDTVLEHKRKFYNAPFFDISKRQKANNLQKYEKEFGEGEHRYGHGLHCPAQVNATICHNRLLEDLKLEGKYDKHLSGDKILWCYTKVPNRWGIKNCASVADGSGYPPEFCLEPDVDKQFEKLYLPVVTQLFKVVGWELPNLKYEEFVDLNDLFM